MGTGMSNSSVISTLVPISCETSDPLQLIPRQHNMTLGTVNMHWVNADLYIFISLVPALDLNLCNMSGNRLAFSIEHNCPGPISINYSSPQQYCPVR